METALSIGDFSRMTHLSVKALRHYHDLGLLIPADVDAASGYRRYDADQVQAAQLIRRFRDLDMPLDEVRQVLDAPDESTRNRAITAHLKRMEDRLEETQTAIASLRSLLESGLPSPSVVYRTIEPTKTLAIRATVAWDDGGTWIADAFAELTRVLDDAGASWAGPGGGLFFEDFFELELGTVVAFVPVEEPVAPRGRVEPYTLPRADLAIMTHHGPFGELDQTYGALGTYVAERGVGVPGPIREYYLVGADDTPDESQHRTDVCWPVATNAA